MNRRAFLTRIGGVTGAATLAAGCDSEQPEAKLIENIQPACGKCGYLLARPDNFSRLPLAQRLGQVLAANECGCGVRWFTTFQRALR